MIVYGLKGHGAKTKSMFFGITFILKNIDIIVNVCTCACFVAFAFTFVVTFCNSTTAFFISPSLPPPLSLCRFLSLTVYLLPLMQGVIISRPPSRHPEGQHANDPLLISVAQLPQSSPNSSHGPPISYQNLSGYR